MKRSCTRENTNLYDYNIMRVPSDQFKSNYFLMKKFSFLVTTLLIVILTFTSCKEEKKITFESLLEEMNDRDRIASYPDPYYGTRQFSSYDRASVSPDEPGWFANWDRSMFIREEVNNGRKEYVMVDTAGPGAIVRIWMTFAGEGSGEGILRFYFDHEETPSIEGPAFDVLSRGQLTEGPLSCPVSPDTELQWRGHNLYMPLPYAEHIKVTYESDKILDAGAKTGGEAAYYNINYRTYEEGVNVETFRLEKLDLYNAMVEKVNDQLKTRDNDGYLGELSTQKITINGTIEPGGTFEHEISGTQAIRKILLQLNADDLKQALRSTVMEIYFDDQRTIWTPVGDFFGTGYQIRNVDTWYIKVNEAGVMESWWIMPFQSKMVLKLHNLGEQPVDITQGELTLSDWRWTRNSMHFGATWLQYTNLYTGERKNNEGDGNPFDLNYTHLRGQGVMVGDVLTLFNTSYAWWGEGDEKIYIDGEDFPSHFGTGTEDYYGYAWCRPEVFNEAFIAQPDGSGNFWPGYTVNLRYRNLDAIPFSTELRFDMEMWHWVSTWINFAPATFFYVKPGAEIMVKPDLEGAKESVALAREDIISPWIENNAIEGENLIELKRDDGRLSWQWSESYGWSSDQHAWWREVPTGSELHLAFKSEREMTKKITVDLTSASDYGIVDISFNNSRSVRFNGYNPDSVQVKELNLGDHKINEGLNEIRIRMVGTAPGREKGMFGLDILRFNNNH